MSITFDEVKQRVERGLFSLAYHPILSTHSHMPVSVEALLRWSKNGVPISPERFIHFIEGSELEYQLVSWSLEKANKEWKECLGFELGISVAINVSPHILTQRLVDIIEDKWPETELLGVEITERLDIRNAPDADATIRSLKEKGVTISLDDYVGSVDCIDKLVSLEIGHVKMDRSLLQAPGDQINRLRKAARLAKTMGLTITAEGVETRQHLDTVAAANIDLWQGYLAAKPMTGTHLGLWLKTSDDRYNHMGGKPPEKSPFYTKAPAQ